MHTMNTILLIGRTADPHIRGIIKELRKLDENFFLVDELSMSDNFQIKFQNGLINSKLDIGNHSILCNKVKSVWNSTALNVKIDKDLFKNAQQFVRSEWTEGIRSIWNTINGKWVNHPSSIYESSNRLKQLQIADKIGFQTPKTLVTNNPNVMLEFFNDCDEEIIAKTLHSSQGLPKNKMIFTTKIKKEDLQHANDLRNAPCMFQEYIQKKTEFRVTIVGNTIRAAEIYSQMSNKTKHDWRQYDDFEKTPYKEATLPSDISKKLLKLMKLMKLEFGAADLIRTPDDEYVFLEINPNGRWWWIQELTGMNIAKDIAHHLSMA